ncbi:MAG: hypothetical protein JWM99_1149 [Verrucomicrobiales bacterium]|nr:hypothetical protein [Verrucomicrobiales bacterium]
MDRDAKERGCWTTDGSDTGFQMSFPSEADGSDRIQAGQRSRGSPATGGTGGIGGRGRLMLLQAKSGNAAIVIIVG